LLLPTKPKTFIDLHYTHNNTLARGSIYGSIQTGLATLASTTTATCLLCAWVCFSLYFVCTHN